jgi:hypothetical protein
MYIIFLSIGCFSSISFCFENCYGNDIDNGFLAKISFLSMGLATLIPSYISFIYLYFLNNIKIHKEWMIRSYTGNIILFYNKHYGEHISFIDY